MSINGQNITIRELLDCLEKTGYPVSQTTLRRWMSLGFFPTFKITPGKGGRGRKKRYPSQAILLAVYLQKLINLGWGYSDIDSMYKGVFPLMDEAEKEGKEKIDKALSETTIYLLGIGDLVLRVHDNLLKILSYSFFGAGFKDKKVTQQISQLTGLFFDTVRIFHHGLLKDFQAIGKYFEASREIKKTAQKLNKLKPSK